MKVCELTIQTRYPNGYSHTDPRLLQGSCEIRTGPESWQRMTHELTPTVLEEIKKLIIKDFLANASQQPIVDLLFTDKERMPPPPPPEPEADHDGVSPSVQ
jgi:hypothetical protein